MKIQDSVALVTGANRGIGAEFVRQLRAGGARKVYAAVRKPQKLRVDGVEEILLDVTRPETIAAAAKRAGDVNLLINNAGISLWTDFLVPDGVRAARSEMETNYFGPLELSRAFAGILARNGGGAIINMLSVVSWVSVPGGGTYSASKAAAWSLTNWLRTDLKRQGTHVLGVHVGPVDTDLASQLTLPKVTAEEVVRQTFSALAAGRPEVLVDDLTRRVKAGLSADAGIYLDFDPRARSAVAA